MWLFQDNIYRGRGLDSFNQRQRSWQKGILFGVPIRKKGLRILWGKERKKEFHVWLFKDKGASFYLYELTIMCGYFKTIYI